MVKLLVSIVALVMTFVHGQVCWGSWKERPDQDNKQSCPLKRSHEATSELVDDPLISSSSLVDLPPELWQIIASYLIYPQTKLHQVNRFFFQCITGYPQEQMVEIGLEHPLSLPYNSMTTVQGITLMGNDDWKKLATIPRYVWFSFVKTVFDLPVSFWPFLEKTAIRVFRCHHDEEKTHELGITNDRLERLGCLLANTQITTIGFYQQSFNQDGLISFFQSLAGGPLRHVHLSGNWHRHLTEREGTALGKSLIAAGVTDLDLSDNRLGDIGVIALIQTLQESPLLKLDLGLTKLTATSGTALGHGLSLSIVKELSLRNNRLGATGLINLLTHLKTSQIRCLDVSFNQVSLIESSVGTALGRALKATQIEEIDLSENKLGAWGLIAVCQELNESRVRWFQSRSNDLTSLLDQTALKLGYALAASSITSLDLSSNALKASDTLAFLKGLEKSALRSLNLSRNRLHPQVDLAVDTSILEDIGHAINKTCLQQVDLSYNLLKTPGIFALLKGLHEQQSPLRCLDLSSNQIACDSTITFTDLGHALASTCLEDVDLSENRLSVSGIIDVLTSLPNSSLRKLNVSSNQLESLTLERVITLSQAIKAASLKNLDLSYNAFDDQHIQLLVETLATTTCGEILLNNTNITKKLKQALRSQTFQTRFEF